MSKASSRDSSSCTLSWQRPSHQAPKSSSCVCSRLSHTGTGSGWEQVMLCSSGRGSSPTARHRLTHRAVSRGFEILRFRPIHSVYAGPPQVMVRPLDVTSRLRGSTYRQASWNSRICLRNFINTARSQYEYTWLCTDTLYYSRSQLSTVHQCRVILR